MDIKAYIASGILELYVYGSLSDKENAEVYEVLQQYPEAVEEVERIENALQHLSASLAPNNPESLFASIENKINKDTNTVIPITRKRTNWPAYIGWAASVALLLGLFLQLNKNRELRKQIVNNQIEQQLLEGKINVAEEDLSKAKSLLSVLRNKDIIQIPLNPQEVDPKAYAAVYWDKETQTAYIDVAGLPAPPPGKVYQVWSLKLDPLTPTSMGILDKYGEDENKIFSLSNPNDSEAFGITLEPEGGSESPTLEMLYTLGVVES
ncbi:anti-sigma factor [Aquimarina sp. 2201CG5-10]|uniref:anti-sigma factor n=1 Tax=Aquimarina callyspongiae TaxID=3098150 RepID=UPI002AB37CC0|nr:anti-sigma factor [Aquimarina sp. 2201CG5-10]MDY8137370.1 anti-sigma factor [Aquimarina sp. 2201CG5-10]